MGCIVAKIDGSGLFVEQAVAHGYLADDKITLFVPDGHQLSRMDAHISFGSSHQYVTLGRTYHCVTVEIELRHAG